MVGDYKVCLNEANAFLSVAKSCLGNNADFLSGKMYPFAVNISFSCELYLKAIMIHKSPTNQFCKGHDLKKLFEDLNNCEQNVIETIYKKRCNEPLRELLEKNSKAFEQWRYAFQDRVSISVNGMVDFAESLQEYVTTIEANQGLNKNAARAAAIRTKIRESKPERERTIETENVG